MRNLFLLLWRNNFLILFFLLMGASVYLIVDQQRFHRASVLNSSNTVVAQIMQTVNETKAYLALRENNDALAKQNAQLLSKDASSFYNATTVRDTVNDSVYFQQYIYIVAGVINNSVNKRNNFITIDKGLLNGIEPDMGVIGASGIVGVVKDVSDHFATVQTLLHSKWRPPAKLKNNNFFGYLAWDGSDSHYITLEEIPANVQVNIGDTIITAPFSTLFPEGIMIGRVSKVMQKAAGDNHVITVKLSTNFNNISQVFIISNKFKKEREKLEEQTQSKDQQQNGN